MHAKLIKATAFVAVLFILRAYFGAFVSEVPAAYKLPETCAWTPKAWARLLGANAEPVENQLTDAAEWACYQHRGQKSRSPIVNTILPEWPSASQRRTWEMTDEDRDPLLAQGGRAALIR